MRNEPRIGTRSLSAGLFVLVVLALIGAWSPPASAHSDEGEMTITNASATSPTTIDVEAGITYGDDDDLAEEALVTVTATDQAGTSVGPIAMPRRTGALYATSIELPKPGIWVLAVSSTDPAANAEAQVDTTSPVATSASSSSTTTPTTTPTTPSTSATAETPDASQTDTSEQTDNSTATVVIVAIALIAAIGAGIAIVMRARRSAP